MRSAAGNRFVASLFERVWSETRGQMDMPEPADEIIATEEAPTSPEGYDPFTQGNKRIRLIVMGGRTQQLQIPQDKAA